MRSSRPRPRISKCFLEDSTSAEFYALEPYNPLEVKKLIVELKSKSSSDIDEVPSIVIKNTPDNLIYALTHIFNKSFAAGKFITAFKKAKVISVFKKGCHNDVAHYRPISLLPVMSKILE